MLRSSPSWRKSLRPVSSSIRWLPSSPPWALLGPLNHETLILDQSLLGIVLNLAGDLLHCSLNRLLGVWNLSLNHVANDDLSHGCLPILDTEKHNSINKRCDQPPRPIPGCLALCTWPSC